MHYLTAVIKSLQVKIDDDYVDRLNYYYTSYVILIFAILVSAKQYVGYPIQCWVPAHFTSPMEQYTENYCWVQNTWWLPISDDVPQDVAERKEAQIVYYQWVCPWSMIGPNTIHGLFIVICVPFILVFQALLFYLPCLIWRSLNWHTGMDIQSLLQIACDVRSLVDIAVRQRTVNSLSRYIQEAISLQRHSTDRIGSIMPRLMLCARTKGYGAYVCMVYVFAKLLYCVNIFVQFYMLNVFLGLDTNTLFGIELLQNLVSGRSSETSGYFPRVTLCDFDVRVLGNMHRHTVQCVLLINLFNEKIFIFLWFWMLALLLMTAISLWYWLIIMLTPYKRLQFVCKYLRVSDSGATDRDRRDVSKFVFKHLRHDGVFVLRMIGMHAGDIVLTEVVGALWTSFQRPHRTHDLFGIGSPKDGAESTTLSDSSIPIYANTSRPNALKDDTDGADVPRSPAARSQRASSLSAASNEMAKIEKERRKLDEKLHEIVGTKDAQRIGLSSKSSIKEGKMGPSGKKGAAYDDGL